MLQHSSNNFEVIFISNTQVISLDPSSWIINEFENSVESTFSQVKCMSYLPNFQKNPTTSEKFQRGSNDFQTLQKIPKDLQQWFLRVAKLQILAPSCKPYLGKTTKARYHDTLDYHLGFKCDI